MVLRPPRRVHWILPPLLAVIMFPLAAARPAVASGTVLPPSITVTNTWVKEGNAGTVNASFQVSLSSAPASGTVSVDVATSNGLALAGSDYTAVAPTTLTWTTVDPLTKTVNVAVHGDTVKEPTETFALNLSNPQNGVIADAQGRATVISEEAPFFVYARDVGVTEGNSGLKTVSFTLALSAAPPAGQNVSVKVATSNGSAVAPGDYTALALTTKTFGAGVSNMPVVVTIKGDTTVEPNETLNLNLSAPSVNAVIADPQAVATIINNDGASGPALKPSVYVTNLSTLEGNAGTTEPGFVVSLSSAPAAGQTVKVNVATANGTATAGSDYTAKALTTLIFTAGQSSKTVTVTVTGDVRNEPNETFSLALSAPVNAVLGDATGAATLLDEEGPFVVYASDAAVVEGDAGTSSLAFTLSLSAAPPAGQSVTVKVATANGSAVAPGDYTALALTTKTFGAGVSSMAVNVPVNGDTTIEADENLVLNLSVPSANAVIGDAQAAGTVLDDDGPPNPVIGPEQAVGDVVYGPAPSQQNVSSIAFDGTNNFVVWQDEKSGDIRGGRVATDGTILDLHTIVVSPTGQDPAVAWDGTNFVVVWNDFRSVPAAGIYAARVNSAGTVLDPEGILISGAADNEMEPAIASNGSDSLITWNDDRVGFPNNDIFGARLSAAGTVLDPVSIQIGHAAAAQSAPAVAWNGTNYYVVWADNRAGINNSDIYGTSVSSAGTVTNVSGTAISTEADQQLAPAITSNGDDFFVDWHDRRSGTSYDVYATRIIAAGTVLSPSGTLISNAALDQWNPALAWNGTNYAVAWQDQRSGTGSPEDIYLTRVSPAGVVLDASGIVVSNGAPAERLPAIAANGSDFFATWLDQRTLSIDIFGSRVAGAGTVQDPTGILVSTATADQAHPAVAWDGTNYLMVWEDQRSATSIDIYAARVAEDGTVLDPVGIPVSTVAGDLQTSPAVAWDGTNFMVVWEDTRDFATGGGPSCTYCTDIYGSRIGTDGTVLDPSGIPISTALSHQESPAIAWNGTSYLVTWTDSRPLVTFGRRDLFGALLSPAGVVTDNDIAIATSSDFDSAVASNGTDFLVVWTSTAPANNFNLYRTRVTGAGAVLDPSGIALAPVMGSQRHPSVVWNGTNYFVAWSDTRSPPTHIYGALLDTTGEFVVSAAGGIPISAAAGAQLAPAAATDGSGFLVLWGDTRAGFAKEDIYGSRLSSSGVVQDPAGLPIAVSADIEQSPAVVEGPSGTQRLLYQRGSSEAPYDGVNRAWWRTIDPA